MEAVARQLGAVGDAVLTGACVRPSVEFEMLSFRAGSRGNFEVGATAAAATAAVVAAEISDNEDSMGFEVVEEEIAAFVVPRGEKEEAAAVG